MAVTGGCTAVVVQRLVHFLDTGQEAEVEAEEEGEGEGADLAPAPALKVVWMPNVAGLAVAVWTAVAAV